MADIDAKSSTDVEKTGATVEAIPSQYGDIRVIPWWKRVASYGVELRGVEPVAIEDRTDNRPINVFSFWWTASLTPLAIIDGVVGTYYEGLSLKAASLTILFFTLLAAIPPALMGTMGPKTGMRQIIQSRYSFGLYAVSLVAILNLATTMGWTIVSTIIAGETLSAVSGGGLSWDLGIVIMALCSLFIAFLGYKIVHLYERWAWIPALIAILICVGCGGHLLKEQAPTEPATAAGVLSYACVVVSFTLTWVAMVSDFCVYMQPTVSSTRIFLYTYGGLTLPTIPLMVLGAAIGGAIPSIPEWTDAFAEGSIGGTMLAMLKPAGGFGKFVAVIIAFTLLGNVAGTMYSISIQFQVLHPFFCRIPRYFFSIITTGIIIAAAIPISKRFEDSLENFLGVISYWGAVYTGVFATELLYFRKAKAANLNPAIWKDASKLPVGIAAVLSCMIPFALIIPCMAETWYVGPIAVHTGDIGFEVGLVLAPLCYIPLRTLEQRVFGR